MTSNRAPITEELNNKRVDTIQWPAKAHRVTSVDSDGLEHSSDNPISVTNTLVGTLSITNAIDETAYDLNSAAFSEVTNISNDFVFDNIELNFSTTESKTITITSSDGTVIYEDTNTEQNIVLRFDASYNANDNITVAVTQFSSAGTMDCILRVRQGALSMPTGNPVLGAGNEIIGKVNILDSSDNEIDETNPLSIYNVDKSGRNSLNTVFGEQIQGIRKADIAAQFQYGFPAGNANTTTTNGGTITVVESMLTLSTSTNVAGSAFISNRKALRYLPGHEAYILFTAVFTEGVADSYQRAGLFDDENGFFIGYEGAQFSVSRRRDSSDTNHSITLNDVFTGFDPTKGNVYRISFGYLGFATIHFEVMTVTGGWVTLYEIQYPNTTTTTHILNTNLPPTLRVANTGNNTNIVAKAGSFTAGIVNGGGKDPASRRFTFDATEQTITAGSLMVITFRSKATFASLTNYIMSRLTLLSFNSDLSKSSLWELRKNMTITNTPSWTDINTNDSTIEYSTDATVTTGTGILDFSTPLGKIDRILITDLEDQEIELLPEDTMTLIITTPGGASGTYDLSFRWKELF